MNNIEPWCISRQLWWGHQIPAWYGPDEKIFVAENEDDAKQKAKKHYGKDVELNRDPDVLDTWFSSGLWPFATLGWPDDKKYVDKFYPTSVLVTGFDIIFFWVARMIMMSIEFTNKKSGQFEKLVLILRDYRECFVRHCVGKKFERRVGRMKDFTDNLYTYDSFQGEKMIMYYEDFVAEQVRAGVSIIGLYPCTKDEHRTAFADWRQKNQR